MNIPTSYWGKFAAKPEDIRILNQRPEVIPMSKGEMYLAACSNILRHDYGFVEATDAEKPQDKKGDWLPLFTYPCIEYIQQFDLRSRRVFEWGAGASTFFFMNRAESVTSIENDPKWFQHVGQLKNPNVKLILDQSEGFPYRIRQEDGFFDVIVVDGAGYRFDCAMEAIRKLAKGGMIILDNSEWHPMTAARLKQSGLIQVDFSGFKVTECHTSTTSVFLHREFDFGTLKSMQPAFCLGARVLASGWDRPYAQEANKDQ